MTDRAPLAMSSILLAAGSSRRFGPENKLLALLGGKPLIRHGAEVMTHAELAEIIVVTGPDAERVHEALAGLAVRFVHNDRYLEGMGGSVAAGVRAVSAGSAGTLISPGDMPQLDPAQIGQLIETFRDGGGQKIVYPCLPDGSQRNPVLWPRSRFAELAALSGEAGAKSILAAYADEATAVPWRSDAFVDIDTVGDLDRHRG